MSLPTTWQRRSLNISYQSGSSTLTNKSVGASTNETSTQDDGFFGRQHIFNTLLVITLFVIFIYVGLKYIKDTKKKLSKNKTKNIK